MNYFDLHSDTVYRCYKESILFDDQRLSVSSTDISLFSKWYQCFAIWIDDVVTNKYEQYLNMLKVFNDNILIHKSDVFTPILAIENAAIIGNNISLLEKLKNDGAFYITLTWNGENRIAGGANSDATLKPFGKDVIKEMNRLNLVCDLSHLNTKSFYSAIEIADNVIASHSCINNVNKHKRNLSCEQIKLIKEKNGIIGLSIYPEFLGTRDIFNGFFKHLYFCLENELENNVSIGTDFDGADIPFRTSKMGELYSFLLNRGISESILKKLFFYNAFKYYKKIDK